MPIPEDWDDESEQELHEIVDSIVRSEEENEFDIPGEDLD